MLPVHVVGVSPHFAEQLQTLQSWLKGISELKPKHLSDGWTASENSLPSSSSGHNVVEFDNSLKNRQSHQLLTATGQMMESFLFSAYTAIININNVFQKKLYRHLKRHLLINWFASTCLKVWLTVTHALILHSDFPSLRSGSRPTFNPILLDLVICSWILDRFVTKGNRFHVQHYPLIHYWQKIMGYCNKLNFFVVAMMQSLTFPSWSVISATAENMTNKGAQSTGGIRHV